MLYIYVMRTKFKIVKLLKLYRSYGTTSDGNVIQYVAEKTKNSFKITITK